MIHSLWRDLGLYEGVPYHIYSGILPCVLGAGFIGAWLRKHNCHQPRCPRLQWHPHPVNGRVVCRRHHPNY